MSFDSFAEQAAPRLRGALVAAYGPEVGADAAQAALAYGWEHWERLSAMRNPAGYLYRVGQTEARRSRRPQGFLPPPPPQELPLVEPGLTGALESLTEPQRVCVVLVHGFGWTRAEVSEVLEISVSSVRTHIQRAIVRLEQELKVEPRV